MHSLWWLQSPGIITCNSVPVPLAHAIISMLELAPRFIFLVQARPFICKQNKCIQLRQHHIHMNIRIVTKKRKYLIIQLACASSSNWSSMYSSRGCGCKNGIDVLIGLSMCSLIACCSWCKARCAPKRWLLVTKDFMSSSCSMKSGLVEVLGLSIIPSKMWVVEREELIPVYLDRCWRWIKFNQMRTMK